MAVLTMDPVEGPYTDIEFEGIFAALNAAYAAGEIDIAPYLLASLVMLLGQRPIQYAALKVSDVSVEQTSEGASIYTLRVPRAKQRHTLTRGAFTNRILIPRIGALLVDYASTVTGRFIDVLANPSQAPLFPTQTLIDGSPGFEHHRTAEALSQWLTNSLRKFKVIRAHRSASAHQRAALSAYHRHAGGGGRVRRARYC
jgi:hypothetical protein